ncbi:putrescine importer [Microbacterium sp. SORGH_AS 888]|nr:putrescine importer [Microbacterium sp. SORGH_AS_0888]
MTPTVVFDTFGNVAAETNNVVPAAYLVALVVMGFTAISYGKMVGVIPSAGSAYTYVRESMHPSLGFLVGWTSLIDYLLLPMVNVLILRSYMEALFPDVPGWVWVVVITGAVTTIVYLTMRGTSNVNMILLLFSIVVMAVFVVLVIVQLLQGAGSGTVVSVAPFAHADVSFQAVLAGATIVCFSFIGFDAVTMYAEEAKTPRTMPRAILLTVLAGGLIFIVAAYFTQLRFPSVDAFPQEAIEDSTLPEIGSQVGGLVLQSVLTAAGFAATLASLFASHASVARMLLVMGRNGVLPRRLFGYISPRTHTPAFTVVLVGVISLLAIAFTLDQIVDYINYGALIAFSFVNLSVIAWFAIRKGRRRTVRDILSYIVLPVIGVGLTGLLWVNLDDHALVVGLIWTGIGLVYLLILTRGFRRPVVSFDEKQPVTGFTKIVEPGPRSQI